MSAAAALLAQARKAGVRVRVDGRDLVLRGKPDADLVQAIREAKGEIVELLTRRRCRTCGAEPTAGELGGFGLEGWRCTRCQRAGGMPVGRVVYLDDLVPAGAPIRECPSCGFTSPLTAAGQCVPCTLGDPPPEPWPNPPAPRHGEHDSPRWLLRTQFKKLARRHPDGVEQSLLKSWFLCELAHRWSAAGEPKLTPDEYTAVFTETLAALLSSGKIVRSDDGRLLP